MKEFQYTVKDACGIHEEAAAAAIQKFLTENV